MPDLSHTPGIYYALAYWISCTVYIMLTPRRLSGLRPWAIHIGTLAALCGFMALTDGIDSVWFFPCMTVDVLLLLTDIRACTGMDWTKSGYICARAFILGEFAASLEWYLFYFGLTVLGFPLNIGVNLLFLGLVHGIVFSTMYLLERKYRQGYATLKISYHELFTASILAFAVFAVSNISFAFKGTPFSSQFTAEIFIIRTVVDLGGVAILYAYHVQLQELNVELEMEYLQNMLHMQYENYRISEESIALVNQKYHDLKHQIQLLRSAAPDEKMEYLDQMEQEIRAYEAQNKTGNRVLDTILAAKSIQCQSEGISLTCVAEGEALGFMDPMDVSTLFGNALDNAMESVKKIRDPEKRLIHVSVARQKNFLRIRVENCYDGELHFEDGIPATTKLDKRYHGYGLKSMRAVAGKYGGSLTIDARDGWFELRLLFPLKADHTFS